MNVMLLPCVHIVTTILFMLILIDCLWKTVLQRGLEHILPEKKTPKMNMKKFKETRRIYKQFESEIKGMASEVIEARLSQGINYFLCKFRIE